MSHSHQGERQSGITLISARMKSVFMAVQYPLLKKTKSNFHARYKTKQGLKRASFSNKVSNGYGVPEPVVTANQAASGNRYEY